jgi:oxygen-independent coproporphyrinogen-3 oxidase
VGAGAHGKVTMADDSEIQRFNNTRLPKDYLARIHNFVAQREKISADEALFEALMNGLRLNDGVPMQYLLDRSLASSNDVQAMLNPFIDKGLVRIGKNVGATPTGLKYLNFILEGLLDND